MATIADVLEATLRRFGVETVYYKCDRCGTRLSEWWKDVKPENRYRGPATMKCICGAISDHESHERRVKPWAKPIAEFLATHRTVATEERNDG